MAVPVELIPARRQALWGWPAVLNFALGGCGAGLYAVALLAAGLERSVTVTLASWLGPALVLAGFGAVATEAGRPLRGPRVLLRVRTSWMSRELWLGGGFVLLALADLVFPLRLHRIQALVLALALILAQGFILRHARGVTAWCVPVMPVVFLASGLLSGAGLWLMVEAARGQRPALWMVAGLFALLLVGLGLWMRYLGWSRAGAFADAVQPLGAGRRAQAIVAGGYIAPLVLLALGAAVPPLGLPAALLAGGAMLSAQVYAKAVLILEAGRLRPVTFAGFEATRRLA